MPSSLAEFRTVICADWSAGTRRRAVWKADIATGRISRLVPPVSGWTVRTVLGRAEQSPRPVVIGFDAPLGLPASFLAHVGVRSFLEWLAAAPDEAFQPIPTGVGWCPARPFVQPLVKGSTWRAAEEAASALKVDLLRRIDRSTGAQSAFRLVGAKQVGGAAIALWRELRQARAEGWSFAVWPFEEEGNDVVVAEIYPAVLYERAVGRRITKSSASDRGLAAEELVHAGFVQPPDTAWIGASDDELDAALSAVALMKAARAGSPMATSVDLLAEGAIVGT